MAKLSIGKISLKPGQTRCIAVGQKKLALFNIDGQYFCLDNACSHSDGPLCEGDLGSDDAFGVTCPWHGSVFDCRTGKVLKGPAVEPVKTYSITEQNGELFVEL